MAQERTVDGLRDIGDQTDAESRLEALEARRDELATQLADMDRDEEDQAQVERLEREVEELEHLVRQRTMGY